MQNRDSLTRMPLRAIRSSICCFLILAIPSLVGIAAEMKPEDAALELQTLEDFQAAAESVARKPVVDAEANYRSKLEKSLKTAQAAGNLKSVLAAKQAIEDLDAGRPSLASDDPDVAAIQKSYIAQRQKAEAESDIALAKADKDHLASLKKLVVELTKAGHIDQAQEVQNKVEAFEAKPRSNTTAAPAVAGQDLEIWKKKALEEFPALKDPASPLSKRVQALKEMKKSAPSYFKNPQWPYLMAKEANQTLPADKTVIRYPSDAKPFNGKRYLVYQEKCSWTAARDKCRDLGGQLVVIPDEPTQIFAKELAGGRRLWLGATDEAAEGRWVWVDGTEMNYNCWDGKQPNNHEGKEHYLRSKHPNGNWWDVAVDDSAVAGYICEWLDPVSHVPPPAK